MPAKIKHVAIVSSNTQRLGEFYHTLFGMSGDGRGGAAHCSDGYIGMNVNGRGPGRQAGLDHFGIEVEDIEEIRSRVQDDYPNVELLQRPGSRSYANVSMHDPGGQVFDLSPVSMENRKSIYLDLADDQRHPRRISHLFLRTMEPERIASFYVDVFGFTEKPREPGDPNHYVTDGMVTLVVAPWKISNYYGGGIERPALDHLGFEVESMDAFKADLEALARSNPDLAPMPIKGGGEGAARMGLLATCKYGQFHLPDPDGVLLDVSEYR